MAAWLPNRSGLREASFSALIGVGVIYLVLVNRPELFGWRVALYGAATGVLVYLSCQTLHRFVAEPVSRRWSLPRPLVAGVAYFFGGAVGWTLGALLSEATGLTRWHYSLRDIGIGLGIAGCLGIVVGLALFFFGRMRGQLEESVSRLKEAEFAEREIVLARDIQQRLLPAQDLSGDGFVIAARNLPARFVAGDFYDVFHLTDGLLGVAVADVSGKGMGASLIMASVKAVLPLVAEGRSASQTARELNRKLAAELAPREFVALAYARFDPGSGALELANAGLPDPYLLRAGRPAEMLQAPGPRLPLGVRPDTAYESVAVNLGAGERLLFLTDGLPEAPKSPGEPLGYEGLAALFPVRPETPAAWLDGLFAAVRAATTPGLEDDWTALLLEARAS